MMPVSAPICEAMCSTHSKVFQGSATYAECVACGVSDVGARSALVGIRVLGIRVLGIRVLGVRVLDGSSEAR
jgi:hypothetical protein